MNSPWLIEAMFGAYAFGAGFLWGRVWQRDRQRRLKSNCKN